MHPRKMSRFLQEESGAVTVDWVVISAMIVAVPLLLYFALDDGIIDTTISIHSEVNQSTSVADAFSIGG